MSPALASNAIMIMYCTVLYSTAPYRVNLRLCCGARECKGTVHGKHGNGKLCKSGLLIGEFVELEHQVHTHIDIVD